MSAYKELKTIDLDGQTDLDYLVYLAAVGRALHNEYGSRNLSTPKWLDDKNRDLTREINAKTAAEKMRQYNEVLAQEASLMTPAEKRELVRQRKEALERELGIAATPAAPATPGQ
jgi:hypothetical protein